MVALGQSIFKVKAHPRAGNLVELRQKIEDAWNDPTVISPEVMWAATGGRGRGSLRSRTAITIADGGAYLPRKY